MAWISQPPPQVKYHQTDPSCSMQTSLHHLHINSILTPWFPRVTPCMCADTLSLYNHARILLPKCTVTSSTFPGAAAWLKALCHFHHKRVSCKTTNFSLFNFCSFRQTHLFFRARHEYFRAEWQIQWRMKREKEWRGWGRGSREVWVIKFVVFFVCFFYRPHKWHRPCRFQSDCLTPRHHWFQSTVALSAFPFPLL